MEYIYMIIRYKVVQDFKGICIAVKPDEQIFVSCVVIRGLVQKTVVYGRVKRGTFALRARLRNKSLANVRLAHPMFKSRRIEINGKSHTSNITCFSIK